MRVLAVDPGERHLGVAVSDPTGQFARPLTTMRHTARAQDAARIVALAVEQQAEVIILGSALDSEGQVGPQARHAEKLAAAVRALTTKRVVLHDESFSSQEAQAGLRAAGKKRRDRRADRHAAAAAVILQSYLDANSRETPPE
ncbi:MAG: Holliday junction resolvase RuvX [Anaerolineales bacterium]|nr:Holliday junction resolvase RuvX [Anaerolineales bacterium]